MEKYAALGKELGRYRGAALRVELEVGLTEGTGAGDNALLPMTHEDIRWLVQALKETEGSEEANVELWAKGSQRMGYQRNWRIFLMGEQVHSFTCI